MSVRVRAAVFPDDLVAVRALVGAYLRQTEAEKAMHGLAVAGAPLPDPYAREVVDPACAFAGMTVLLAETDGAPVGVVVCVDGTDGREVKRLWVDPAVRGTGAGRALLDAVLASSARPVRLTVWRWREPAIRLYRRLGFAEVPSWDDRRDLVCLQLD
ncbi:GNAT family N-acetyltransferase [Microbacterium gilvum]|uniref:N-acetyltransferase domain-containing protein n=1 Tax=Microbacterium gilvum TaxID=1336204 RepID=A0ABP8ZU09_9MICO